MNVLNRSVPRSGLLVPVFFLLMGTPGADTARAADEPRAETYRVPYQLTETKHVLVRTRINDKGPFHFIIDTGAPALYLGTEAAKKLGIKADDKGWGMLERFEVEGGVKLANVKARVEDPFQLTGMNRLNIPGIRLDGIMGYTLLAHYRIEYDFTRPHLVWTKLNWQPPAPRGLGDLGGEMPKELAAMSGLVNFATTMIKRRPDPVFVPRGFFGLELVDGENHVRITRVLPDSPAAAAELKAGDRITKLDKEAVANLAQLHKLCGELAADQEVRLEIVRDGQSRSITLQTRKGF
jgi:hypothetical protein